MNRLLTLVVAVLVSALIAGGVVIFVFVLPPVLEVTPPAAITDLATSNPTMSSITLTWAAPGDDGNTGTATGYEVKYSTSGPITAANWDLATTYPQAWTPLPAGSAETRVVSGLSPGTTYWFALKAYDEVPNLGGISNSPSGTTATPGDTPERNLALETVYSGLNIPVAFAFAPDGRIFYNELQAGGVRIIKDGTVLPTPFVSLNVVGRNEMGLLGLALDPNFGAEPFVYVFYTYQDVDGPFNRISRFPALGDVAGPEEVLLNRLPANDFHNSGRVGFGPDGFLYASLGDTGDGLQSQDPQTLPGKILRLHRDGALPADNPFAASYTYLYGIRNVFGFDFSPAGTLFFTENGPRGNDEVNRGLRGENYGWPEVQGADPDPRFVPPLAVFSPAIAPTGLGFYTGDRLGPAHTQVPYFGSWNFGRLYRLVEDAEAAQGFRAEYVLDPGLGGLLDVVNGPDGYLYVSFPDRIARVILEPVASLAPNSGFLPVAPREAELSSDMTAFGSPPPLTRLKSEVRLTESAREGGAGGLGWSRAPG